MSCLQLYFILKLNAISNVFIVLCFLSAIFCIVTLFIWGILSETKDGKVTLMFIKRHFKWIIPCCFVCGLISQLIPTTKEMAAIIVIPKVINAASNNKQLNDLPGDIISLTTSWIKELRPENIKGSAKSIIEQTK